MFHILVAEDDDALNKMICVKLKQENYQVWSASNGIEALDIMEGQHIDLLISDIMMPELNGYELTKSLRDSSYNMPILLITAREEMEYMERGFRMGTDDYMVKPIRLKELVLRVGALLRRAQIANEHKLMIGDITLNYNELTVYSNNEIMELPKKEFYLLYQLLSYPNKIFTRQQLLEEIWGMDAEVDERTVDSHIKKLRRKFENVSEFEIVTIRGLGYKVRKNV
jgi:two-component system, OmpR family, response regulator